jgi:hypothetical protein
MAYRHLVTQARGECQIDVELRKLETNLAADSSSLGSFPLGILFLVVLNEGHQYPLRQ